MLWSAFLLGLLGSFHCVGMCGPIALALPSKDPIHLLTYNVGRSLTYATLGGLMGSLGYLLPFAEMQQWLSIVAGALILVYVLLMVLKKRLFFDRYFANAGSSMISRTRRLFKSSSPFSNAMIGIANGFLPCGLVYMGLVGALATGTFADGAIYMILFGLGTIPVMFGLSITGRVINTNFRSTINKMVPSFLFVIAILFILRGMNLGIPYVSPKLTDDVVTTTECK